VLMSLTARALRAPGPVGLAALVFILTLALLGPLPAAQASSSCPNELFRTGPGANLPDCRAYELVSPPQKNGGEVDGGPNPETIPAPEQAALNGQSVTYGSQTAFPATDPAAGMVTMQYISRRTPTGWTTQAITPEQDLPGGVFDQNPGAEGLSLFTGFSEDLSHAYLNANEPSPVPGAPAGYYNPYLRDNEDNSYSLLSDVTPPNVPPGPADGQTPGLVTEYAGMSSDGSHVIFTADDALTPEALPGSAAYGEHKRDLYEWVNGHLELVSLLPADEGGKAVEGQFGSVAETSNHGHWGEDFDHVLSADGSRAYWGDLEGELFLHELTPAGPETVRISASQRTGGEQAGERLPAHYRGASVDGSKVYFTSCQRLTDDSTAEPSEVGCNRVRNISRAGEDLYQYDANTGKLIDLTVAPVSGQTANVRSVLGMSEDGSYVYFVAQGALTEGAPSGENIFNIYVWHDGEIKLIASTTGSDYFAAPNGQGKVEEHDFIEHGFQLTKWGRTRVSPSGRYLVFESSASLTGYDNQPVQAGDCERLADFGNAGSGAYDNGSGRCIEVYEYDFQAGKLVCASCNPAGLPPVGNSFVPMAQHLVTVPGGWQSTTVQQRYLLDDGRVFFDSTDALLPQASNAGEADVYEYESDGVGDCTRQAGCLALISTGTSNANSLFIDSSASGEDVFFLTRQSLVAEDGDEALDLYDARVDGGLVPPVAPPCGGEACRPPVTPAPSIYQAPPSATFVGAGNPVQPANGLIIKLKPKSKRKSKSKARKRKSQAQRQLSRRTVHNASRGTHR
jgi:hypothetical protein